MLARQASVLFWAWLSMLFLSCGEDAALTYSINSVDPNSSDSTAEVNGDVSASPEQVVAGAGAGAGADGKISSSDINEGTTIRDEDHYVVGADDLPSPFSEDDYSNFADFEKEWSFTAGHEEITVFEIAGGELSPNMELTLRGKVADGWLKEQQIERSEESETFAAGGLSTTVDNFIQSAENEGVIDILVVVDNSGSMQEEQQNLAAKLDPLLSYVAGSNWRIAINTTDPMDGCLLDVINKADGDSDTRFAASVTAGTSGSGNERGVLQAVNGLASSCIANSWLRENSTLAVLIVSDEDNCSDNGSHCAGEDYADTDYLLDYLGGIRSVGEDARVYGIFSDPANPCATAYNDGTQYSEMVATTGGAAGDICDGDYSQTLEAISQNMATILKHQFALSSVPLANTVVVKVDGAVWSSGYSVTGSTIEFTNVPPDGALIEVSYDAGTEAKTDYQLAKRADSRGLVVKVNGVVVSNYLYDQISRVVKFSVPPPDAATIEVRYQDFDQLEADYFLGKNAVPSSLRVYADSALLASGAYLFNQETGILSLHAPVLDGVYITIEYQEIITPILEYSLPWSSDLISSISDTQTGETISFAISERGIVVSAADFRHGRVLTLSLVEELPSLENLSFVQSLDFVAVNLQFADGSCDITEAVRSSQQLSWSGDCAYDGVGMATVNFVYQRDSLPAIDLSEKFAMATLAGQFIWRIWVDGNDYAAADIHDGFLEFQAALAFGSEVVARVVYIAR